MSYARSGTTFTVGRGAYGTEPVHHSNNDTAQECIVYEAETASNIVYDLLTNYSDVNPAWIDKPAWDLENDTYNDYLYTTVLASPYSVEKLITEMCQQASIGLWQNEITESIYFEHLKPVPENSPVVSDTEILQGTFSSKIKSDSLVTRITTSYNQKDYTKKLTEDSNYQSLLTSVGGISAHIKPEIREIKSRWIPKNGFDTAKRVNQFILERFQLPPREFSFSLIHGELSQSLEIGQAIFVNSRDVIDCYGSPETTPCRIVSLSRKTSGIVSVIAEEFRLVSDPQFYSERTFTIDSDTIDLNLRSLHDSLKNSDPESGDEYTFIVAEGIKVGGSPGIDVGNWPTGVILNLINQGAIYGRGGAGHTGVGGAGHDAIHTAYPINIDNTNSLIAAGGGGGGGVAEAQGGGGQGFPGGTGYQNGTHLAPGGGDTIDDNPSDGISGDGGSLGAWGHNSEEDPPGTGYQILHGGGPPGKAVVGDTYINWIATGTIIGSVDP